MVMGLDALGAVCSSNTNVIMALWLWHGCSGHRMLQQRGRNYGLGLDALVTVCSSNTNVLMILAWMLWSPYALATRTLFLPWAWMLWSPYAVATRTLFFFALGMYSLFTVCSNNTNVLMVWAWMLWAPYALGTRTLLVIMKFGHACSRHRML